MLKLIDLSCYRIIENETKKKKTYTIIWCGSEQKKVNTIEEVIRYIYEQEYKYINNDPYKEVSWNDKTN